MSVQPQGAFALTDVLPGMEISKVVLMENGKVLLSEGTVLTESMIERLRSHGISHLHVKVKGAVLTTDVFERQPSAAQLMFCAKHDEVTETMQRTFDAVRRFKKIPSKEMSLLVEDTLLPLVNTPGAMNYLHREREADEYTFVHSVNVGIMAGVLGHWLGYKGEQLQEITLAGLLHDMGKTQIPQHILNKPLRLNEEEMKMMRLHPIIGYKLAQDSGRIPHEVALGILQHHERMNGSGYPSGVNKERIHPYAKILAVVDTYDAMTSPRAFQSKGTPPEAIKIMLEERFDRLDPDICTVFLDNLRDSFIGNLVELSDGSEAEILHFGSLLAPSPVLRTKRGSFVNLGGAESLQIVRMIAR